MVPEIKGLSASMDCFTVHQRRSLMARIRNRDTKPERRVRSILHRSGYRFRLHRRDLPGRPDIVLPARLWIPMMVMGDSDGIVMGVSDAS
jgi:DNA mismatch endonuclease Vsr